MIDAYNIIEYLNADPATQKYASSVTVDQLQELITNSDNIARNNAPDYKTLVSNVLNAAFRRDAWQRLNECEKLCLGVLCPRSLYLS